MKKALSLILSLLIAVSVFAAAPVSAGAADDYDYTVDDSGNATITKYTGDQPAPVGGVVEPIQVEIPSELDGNTVTEIGDRAFKDIYFVDEITCPDTVTAVGDNAFENCIRLKSVNLPKSLTTIGNYVFSNTMISSVVIPKMLTEAGDSGGAFSGATELETAVFEDGMEGIPNYLFQNATALKEIVIPDSVTWIGQYSFSGCVFLRKVTFGNSIDIIYNSAFENCISLTYVKFPDSITNIRVEAFKGCTNLRSVILPRSLRWLGGAAFKGTAIPTAFRAARSPCVKT